MNDVKLLDLSAWVEQAPSSYKAFREAVHLILQGVGQSKELHAKMVMKGGLLMAIRYESSRFTRDIDFSTTEKYQEGAEDALVAELDHQLLAASEHLPYSTRCKIQSFEIRPRGQGKTHQSLKLKIGYADSTNPRAFQRLQAKQSPQVVEIDYSYNEAVFDVEVFEIEEGVALSTYSLHNVMAEKLRSLLQQPIRNRNRRQDVYDLHLLLTSDLALTDIDLQRIHGFFVDSCKTKDIVPDATSMEQEIITAMAQKDYGTLQDEVEGKLPTFDVAMASVQKFYRALPW
jgi:predicted nucleotidyltransferase component of viral defense system